MPIDFENRVIDSLDELRHKMNDLCIWKTKMEVEWQTHMNAIEQKAISKEKRFYIIIALMGVGFTIQEIIRSFL